MLCILFWGCIEEISVELPSNEIENLLVVDGQIHTGPGPYTIQLKRVAGSGLGAIQPVEQAAGSVFTASGKEEALQEVGEGLYLLPGNTIQGEVGETYTLELQIGDSRYMSKPETIPEPVQVESIRWQYVDKEFFTESNVVTTLPFVEIYIDTPVPEREDGPFFRWRTLETYSLVENPPPPPGSFSRTCYFTFPTNLQTVSIFNGEAFSEGRWENQWVGDREIDWTFSSKHVFSVVQYTTTQGAYTYWEQVQRVTNQVGSIFDTPPAAVGGNMSNSDDFAELVLGYFEAVSVDTIRTFTVKSDFEFRLAQPRCVNLGFFDPRQPAECYNCLLLEGAEVDRPPFF